MHHTQQGKKSVCRSCASTRVPRCAYMDWIQESMAPSVLLQPGPATVALLVYESRPVLKSTKQQQCIKAKDNKYGNGQCFHELMIEQLNACGLPTIKSCMLISGQ